MNPTPAPSSIDLQVDPSRVTPGILGFLALMFLILAVVVIYFSMRKQLSRIDFDDGAMPAGVRPLPKYATKAERRKAADAARGGGSATGGPAGATGGPDAPNLGSGGSGGSGGRGAGSAGAGSGPSAG